MSEFKSRVIFLTIFLTVFLSAMGFLLYDKVYPEKFHTTKYKVNDCAAMEYEGNEFEPASMSPIIHKIDTVGKIDYKTIRYILEYSSHGVVIKNIISFDRNYIPVNCITGEKL